MLMKDRKPSSLTLQARVGYMCGGAAQTTIVMLINVVLTYFYTNVMGINIAKVAAVMLISRIFDGFSDIVAGVVIDRTKSKYGKARPWLLRMALPHFIGLIAMFTVPPHATEMAQLVYIFVAYNFANTFVNTFAGLALSSLNSLMTRDPEERSQLNALRQFGAPVMELAITALAIPVATWLGGDQKAYLIVVGVISAIATLCYLICFFGAKETNPEERGASDEKIPVGVGFLAVLKNKYWYMVLIAWVMDTFYLTISGANLSYYCQYILNDLNFMGILNTAEKLSTIVLTAAAVPFLIPRLGKRNMTLAGSLIVALGHLTTLFAPTNRTLAVLAAVLRGAGLALCFAVLFAMIADCVEYGHWKFNLRTEGLIFCAATVGQKFGQGIASAILGGLLDQAGYDGTLAVQSASANWMISAIYLATPVICLGIVAVVMLFYRLDREMPQIMHDLEQRKQEVAS